MKTSKYTFLFDVNRKEFYTYNTLSNALVEIDEESYALLRSKETGVELSEADFDKVLGNIELLNDLASEINVAIRVNLTLENNQLKLGN